MPHRKNKFRSVKGVDWLRRELKRLESIRPVSFGDARISLEAAIADAKERLAQLTEART